MAKKFRTIAQTAGLVLLVACALSGCATYYQVNLEFNQHFENGELEEANAILDKNKKQAKKKSRFLYYVNKGVVESMLGNYELSNQWFEKAYIFGEDYKKEIGGTAASFLVNQKVTVYPGEDHEHLLLLYFKALNYLRLNDREAALVECRRLNNRLNELSDKYKSDRKYKEDAFIHTLMGIIYDADGDYNNAFIAYRNAYNTYKDIFEPMFGVAAPDQLKKDLIRSAALTGFETEAEFYRREFDLLNYNPSNSKPELVLFWHNGLGPVKDEWSLDFTTGGYSNGFYTFIDQTGRVHTVAATQAQANQISNLSFVRVAFPTYLDRPPVYQGARLHANGDSYEIELVENVNAVARKVLNERMAAEIGKGLMRLALKKVIENQARQQDETIGFLLSIFNAATEQADTRNWQTIPYAIHYVRVPLNQGENQVKLLIDEGNGSQAVDFNYKIKNKETVFQVYHTLDSHPPQN